MFKFYTIFLTVQLITLNWQNPITSSKLLQQLLANPLHGGSQSFEEISNHPQNSQELLSGPFSPESLQNKDKIFDDPFDSKNKVSAT